MHLFPALISGAILVIGLVVALRVNHRPQTFWPTVWTLATASAGLIVGGYTLLHEYLIGCLALLSRRKGSQPVPNRLARVHFSLFSALMFYLIIESVRGLVALDSARKIRWVFFYLLLYQLGRLAFKAGPDPSCTRRVARVLAATGLVYFVVYCFWGLSAELFFGINRYDLQPGHAYSDFGIFGSSSYAMFPFTVTGPAMFISTRDHSRKWRLIGWVGVLVTLFAATYYDSRSAVLAVSLLFLPSARSLGIVRTTLIVGALAAIVWGFMTFVWTQDRDVAFYFDDLLNSGNALWNPNAQEGGNRDFYRAATLRAAFATIRRYPLTLVFGLGNRVSGFEVGESVAEEYSRAGLDMGKMDPNRLQLEAAGDFVANFGLFGLALLLGTFGVSMLQVWRESHSPNRWLVLMAFIGIAGWTFAINFLDVPLFYMTFMPNGPLLLLAKSREGAAGLRPSAPGLSTFRYYRGRHLVTTRSR